VKIIAIVPAYNEQDSIVSVIKDIKSVNSTWDIVIVNDGSKDNTKEVAESTGQAFVINLVTNLGIGGAVQTGFKFANDNGYDIAFQFDGDGQHLANEIPKILNPIVNKQYDFIIGSRFTEYHDGWKSSFLRRTGISFFRLLNSLIIKQKITDNTSGFRAYNKKAIRFLSTNYPQDYPEPENVIMMGKNGFKIGEVFTLMQERTGGTSSISLTGGIYYMVKVTLAILMTALRPKII